MIRTPDLEAIRQEHESWLNELEGLAVEAISSNDWNAFYAHVADFQNDLHGESGIAIAPTTLELFFPRVALVTVSTKSLSGSGADFSKTTAVNERKEQNPSWHNNPN